jgi:hyperosmotically inducible protein
MKKLLLIPALCLVCAACCGNGGGCGSNNDQVQSQEMSSDWSITTKVKAEILSDTSISASARFVSVSTTDGVVTLTGSVPTREDRERIYRIARKVNGVKRVDNQITISK